MSSPFKIRRFRLADLDQILAIERASFRHEAYHRDLFVQFFNRCGDLFLVAGRGARLCGYAITCAKSENAELVSIAVDPSARGMGAGSALMKSTLRRLRLRNIKRCTLMVKVTKQTAVRFYFRFGFHRVRRVRAYYQDGKDAWLMARNFASRL